MEIPRIIGAGLIVLGVGIGLGKIGAAALEAIARQPEQSGKIQTALGYQQFFIWVLISALPVLLLCRFLKIKDREKIVTE